MAEYILLNSKAPAERAAQCGLVMSRLRPQVSLLEPKVEQAALLDGLLSLYLNTAMDLGQPVENLQLALRQAAEIAPRGVAPAPGLESLSGFGSVIRRTCRRNAVALPATCCHPAARNIGRVVCVVSRSAIGALRRRGGGRMSTHMAGTTTEIPFRCRP